LTTPWVGRVWCNPPYSNPTPWAKKLIAHDNGIALVQVSKSDWFHLIWSACSGALVLPKNIKFVRATGQKAEIFMPVILFALGESNREVLVNSGLGCVR
jgi:hypothetical protein